MEFLLLGPLEVRAAGRTVDLDGDRQRKVLAVLLLNANRIVSVEQLIDELWTNPPPTARRQVYNTASALRRQLVSAGLPPCYFTTVAGGYRLTTRELTVDLDLARQALESADTAISEGRHDDAIDSLTTGLALWRGAVLAGLQSPLIDSVSARLNEDRVSALERLAQLRLALGDDHTLVADLIEHVTRYPLRESLRGSLMLALSRSGRQAEALTVYESGRQRLAEELGLDPGPELRRVHAAVLRGTGPQPATAEARPAAPPPAPNSYLPPRLADLVGHEAELDTALHAVHAATAENRPAVVLFHGMGGIGKTTLATELAHRLAHRYPDGQLFLDLQGFTPHQRPLSPALALRYLREQLGLHADDGSPDPQVESARLRAALASRRVLLVLDNVCDSALIRQVLPDRANTLVLVTSRRQLAGLPGALPIGPRAMSVHDAVTLFERVCGQARIREEPAACHQVVQLCGLLPFAVRAAANRLRHRPLWSVADLAEQLRAPTGRLQLIGTNERNLAEVLRVSYGRLASPQQSLFRMLSRQAGPYISARACATVGRLSVDEAEQGLEILTENSLLLAHDRRRYMVHPLVRDLATQLAVQTDAA